jgi:hypothetical protein
MNHISREVSVDGMSPTEKKAYYFSFLVRWVFSGGTPREHWYFSKDRHRKFYYFLTDLPEGKFAVYQEGKVYIVKGVGPDNAPIHEGKDVFYSPTSTANIKSHEAVMSEGEFTRGIMYHVRRIFPHSK